MKNRILYFVPEKSGIRPNASSFIRILSPLYLLSRTTNLRVLELENAKDLLKPNVLGVTLNRTSPLQLPDLLSCLPELRERGIPIHWDIDDLIVQQQGDDDESRYINRFFDFIPKMLRYVSIATCSTNQIANSYINNFKMQVVPNMVPPNTWSSSADFEGSNVLFFGHQVHENGLQILSSSLNRISDAMLRKINLRIDVIGNFQSQLHWTINKIDVPPDKTYYPSFAHFLSTKNKYAIGIAPISNIAINQGKSALKFLEYSSMALPTLASNHVAITSDPEANSLCFTNTLEHLAENLVELCSRKNVLRSRGQDSLEIVNRTRTQSLDVNGMQNFYHQLFYLNLQSS